MSDIYVITIYTLLSFRQSVKNVFHSLCEIDYILPILFVPQLVNTDTRMTIVLYQVYNAHLARLIRIICVIFNVQENVSVNICLVIQHMSSHSTYV